MALPNVHRLRHRQEFNRVYQLGTKRVTSHLILRALSPLAIKREAGTAESSGLEAQPPIQIGISVSRKVSKRAVVRNRIKRQIQAALHQLLPRLSPGWRIVIVVKPSAIQCDYEEFLRELEQLLTNTEVCDGHSGRSLL